MKFKLLLLSLSSLFAFSASKTKHTRKLVLTDEEKNEAKKQVWRMIKTSLDKYTDYVQTGDAGIEIITKDSPISYSTSPEKGSAPSFTITDITPTESEDGYDIPYRLLFEKVGGTKVRKIVNVALLADLESMQMVPPFIEKAVSSFMFKMMQVPYGFEPLVDEIINMIKFNFVKVEGQEGKTEFASSIDEVEDKKTEKQRVFKIKIDNSEFDYIELSIQMEGEEQGIIDRILIDIRSSYFDVSQSFRVITVPFIVYAIESSILRIKKRIYDSLVKLNQKGSTSDAVALIKKETEKFHQLQSNFEYQDEAKGLKVSFEETDHRFRLVLERNVKEVYYLNKVALSLDSAKDSQFNVGVLPGLFFNSCREWLYKVINPNILKEVFAEERGEEQLAYYIRMQGINVPFVNNSKDGNDALGYEFKAHMIEPAEGCELCLKHVIYRVEKKGRVMLI